MTLQIRWMIRRDTEEVLNIEAACFQYPWTEDDLLTCLRQRNHIGMVAESVMKIGPNAADIHEIHGFMIYALLKTELYLLNFAVDPAFRRQGVGRHMVDKLIFKLSQQGRSSIRVMCRESNLGSHLFFRRQGFVCERVQSQFYVDTNEDGYQFRYTLRNLSQPFAPVNRIS